jgi:transposase-like protein
MIEGDVFYTRSETTGRVAPLVTYKCPQCGSTCLRSLEGSVSDDNLDEMRHCVYDVEV